MGRAYHTCLPITASNSTQWPRSKAKQSENPIPCNGYLMLPKKRGVAASSSCQRELWHPNSVNPPPPTLHHATSHKAQSHRYGSSATWARLPQRKQRAKQVATSEHQLVYHSDHSLIRPRNLLLAKAPLQTKKRNTTQQNATNCSTTQYTSSNTTA